MPYDNSNQLLSSVSEYLFLILYSFYITYSSNGLPFHFLFFILYVCFTVRFQSCDGNKKIHFGSSEPEDFRIDEDGVVYAERSFQLSAEPTEFVVSAQDKETQEEWQMRVKLTPEPAFTGASEKVKQPMPSVWMYPRKQA